LGYRLFRILDGDKNNKLNYEEFECGLLELLNNKEMRIIFSFKAYDKDEDN
jgi:Ca2+-binding EF-hand superfamily protein